MIRFLICICIILRRKHIRRISRPIAIQEGAMVCPMEQLQCQEERYIIVMIRGRQLSCLYGSIPAL